ncbi:MAG TPA: 50S ribosomal protein L13 [Candidatus Nanoarchaeia archaeon]|nr:50S ribosomal protein L13 [Candidatus Nanoarchaeia archaeon]
MLVIDGTDQAMGRLAVYVAKKALKGEEIAIVNCDEVIITGNKTNILKEFNVKRSRVGSSQKGPKHKKVSKEIVKRAIRGMLPDYRYKRGRQAWKRIWCYNQIPKELEGEKIEKPKIDKNKKFKYSKVKEFTK